MSQLVLYWRPGTCARVVFTALEETGIPFAERMLNPFRGDVQSAEYLAINPKAQVPALQVDDWVLTESPVILQFLSESFPDARLLPTSSQQAALEAAAMMAWFASYTMHGACGRQLMPAHFTLSKDQEAIENVRLDARQVLTKNFGIIEMKLDGREWLFEDWTIVDVYLHYLFCRGVGSGVDPTPFRRLVDHGQRCEQRPALAKVIDREEAEWRRFEREGLVPEDWPPRYVGRIQN
jgi:glutathione S-transferase